MRANGIMRLFMESEEPLRSTTGPKGRKRIDRGEAPGKEIKDNQPRRGGRKGSLTWPKYLPLRELIIVLITENKIPCRPFGAYIVLLSSRGLHPPLYPVGLSGLILNFVSIKVVSL